jgi:phosphate transport system permease protein
MSSTAQSIAGDMAGPALGSSRWTDDSMRQRVARRYAAERRFKLLGLAAVAVSIGFLAFLLITMVVRGAGGLSLDFLQASDSTDPAFAGVWGALKGSFLTIIVTMALAFPVGVLSAVYLEEFAQRSRFNDFIEVSINNLAAVPSIIFGLLGLAVFLNLMDLPRSAALVGGLTLALMTMPVIVIAGRNAIKSVPPSIRDAALGVGASRMQVVFHHVLPLALPGILTGTIIGMARALGETAPLLMIGMRAFIAAPPRGLTDPATALPVQIFLWSDEVDRAFVEKTSAAIIVLLVFMLLMNGLAIYLRNRFERRW